MSNFWQQLPSPFLVLAPMEDVTDTVFREVVMSVSSPEALHVVFTEFTSTDGMCHERGRTKVMERLIVNQSERQLLKSRNTRLVAQIWGSDPDNFRRSAAMINETGLFDGIDINMGCPVNKVVKHKSCSNLINFPDLAKEIILATAEATSLPVSVKTRIGFNTIITESWIGHLLEVNPAAISIHGRTRKMMSEGPAHWDEIARAVKLRNEMGKSTVIIGNGQIGSYDEAIEKSKVSAVEGVMIGTGIFRNPWLFNTLPIEISTEMRISLLKKHIQLYQQTWGNGKDYNVLKRFYKIYLNGFPGAAHWRDQLMRAGRYKESLMLIEEMKAEVAGITVKC